MIEQGHIMDAVDDRAVSPFAGVIAIYRNHIRKICRRDPKKHPESIATVNETRAVSYYTRAMELLEAL